MIRNSSNQSLDTAAASTAIFAALKNFDVLPDSAEVRVPTVAALMGVSVATVWRWSREGLLPKPRKIGPGVTCWNVGEIRAALAAQKSTA